MVFFERRASDYKEDAFNLRFNGLQIFLLRGRECSALIYGKLLTLVTCNFLLTIVPLASGR